jgi:hypothetical protein
VGEQQRIQLGRPVCVRRGIKNNKRPQRQHQKVIVRSCLGRRSEKGREMTCNED